MTAVRRDKAYDGRYTRNQSKKKSVLGQGASVYCLVALPLYRADSPTRLVTENISPNSHGTLFQYKMGHNIEITSFLAPLGKYKNCLYGCVYIMCEYLCLSLHSVCRSVAHFHHYFFSLKSLPSNP